MIATTIVAFAFELPSSAFLILLLIALASLALTLLLLTLDDQNCPSRCISLHLLYTPLFVLFFKFSGPFGSTGFGPLTSSVCFQPLGHRQFLLHVALDMGSHMFLQMGYQPIQECMKRLLMSHAG